MIDFANITAHAGDGGNGTGSFRHIKGKRYGKADGGNGGNGGSVYLVASRDLNTLEPYRFVKDYKAQSGQNGSSNLRRGADSEDLILKVPIGTQVKVTSAKGEVISQKLSTIHYSLITDLVAESDKVLVARGGQGGRGNAYLRDEYGRRPRQAELGEEGEKVTLTLELKLIADVGLIGLPNASKSTLLAALTAARPKIAAYPFTTLEPNLGVLTPTANGKRQTANGVKQSAISGKHLILADIPGLIENASLGRGLGVQFLRHIERTKLLLHLIDISTSENPWGDYQTIRKELKNYNPELARKKEIVVLNKIDLIDKNRLEEIKKEFSDHRKKAIPISAQTKIGLEELVREIELRVKS